MEPLPARIIKLLLGLDFPVFLVIQEEPAALLRFDPAPIIFGAAAVIIGIGKDLKRLSRILERDISPPGKTRDRRPDEPLFVRHRQHRDPDQPRGGVLRPNR